MYSLKKLLSVMEKYAPLSISRAMIEKGDYDNSGIIVKSSENVNKILFSLDLSDKTISYAKRLKCDTIVTHHPAIYSPLKSLSCDEPVSASVLNAIRQEMNVISFHLNLDMAKDGIDQNLAKGLGAKNCKILDYLDKEHGYGREFEVEPISLSEFVGKAQKTFNTKKTVVYGNGKEIIKKVASFCGGGASHAENAVLKGLTDAQLVVTSDMAHHVIKALIEKGKSILILPHYVSENYGFKEFYSQIKEELGKEILFEYFEDKRFM